VKFTTVLHTVEHIQAALVAAANKPITYAVKIGGKTYDIVPEERWTDLS
jgi:hypothetical protein